MTAFLYRDGALADGRSDRLRIGVSILVVDERIVWIRPGDDEGPLPKGVAPEIVDASGCTIVPGLIDCHTHLGARADRYNPINAFKETPYTQGFAAEKNARTTLLAGFRTVRDVGSGPFMAVDLRYLFSVLMPPQERYLCQCDEWLIWAHGVVG